jgi:hypothetical protein
MKSSKTQSYIGLSSLLSKVNYFGSHEYSESSLFCRIVICFVSYNNHSNTVKYLAVVIT